MLGLAIMSMALSMTIGAAIAQSFHKDGVTTALRIQLMITTMLGAILIHAIDAQLLHANWYKLPIISIVLAVIAGIKFHRHLLKENNNGKVW